MHNLGFFTYMLRFLSAVSLCLPDTDTQAVPFIQPVQCGNVAPLLRLTVHTRNLWELLVCRQAGSADSHRLESASV